MIPGARFLPPGGHQSVSRCRTIGLSSFTASTAFRPADAAVELRRRGFDARTLAGGITAWLVMGVRSVPFAQSCSEGEGA
jgi:hypothetical protein